MSVQRRSLLPWLIFSLKVASVHLAGSLSLNCLVADPSRPEASNMESTMMLVVTSEIRTYPFLAKHLMLSMLAKRFAIGKSGFQGLESFKQLTCGSLGVKVP
jgi:hypothetical protein